MASTSSRSIYTYVAIDTLLLIILGVLVVLTSVVIHPQIRGFFRHDISISLPHVPLDQQTVTIPTLMAWVVGAPALLLIFSWLYVDRIWSNDFTGQGCEQDFEFRDSIPLTPRNMGEDVESLGSNYSTQDYSTGNSPLNKVPGITSAEHINSSGNNATTDSESLFQPNTRAQQPGVLSNVLTSVRGYTHVKSYNTPRGLVTKSNINLTNWGNATFKDSTPRGRKVRFALYQCFVFAFILLTAMLITGVIKLTVARLRPDYLSRCQPDFNYPGLVIDAESGYISGEWAAKICTGDEKVVIEGRKSHPSGHSSSAAVSSTFLALYLFKRFSYRGRAAVASLFIPILITIVITVALWVAASRHIDNWHHPLDIIMGLVIGTVCGLLSLCFEPFVPSWELDGSLHAQHGERDNNCPSSELVGNGYAQQRGGGDDIPL